MDIFGIIGTPLGWIMYAIESVIHNYGLSLIMFIIVTKIAMFPLAIKQQKSTAKMASVSSKQKELQKKYGKDKAKMQEAQMKLYEEEGVNPMGGCLPMLLNFAILFGIIDVVYKPLKHLLRVPKDMILAATKTFTENISYPEIEIIKQIQNGATQFDSVFSADWISKIKDFDMMFLGMNMGEVPTVALNLLIIIPILSGITALMSTLISMKIQKQNGQEMQGGMKYMMLFMPLMSVWIGFSMPAGAGIYWTISNITMIAQSIIVQAIWPPSKVALMTDKSSERTKEKMRKKRKKMEEYNKTMEARGLSPKPIPKKLEEPKKIDKEALAREKEATSAKLAEARRRMAEKYGETYEEEK